MDMHKLYLQICIPVDNPFDERFNCPVFLARIMTLFDNSALSSFLVRCLNTAERLLFFLTPLMLTFQSIVEENSPTMRIS